MRITRGSPRKAIKTGMLRMMLSSDQTQRSTRYDAMHPFLHMKGFSKTGSHPPSGEMSSGNIHRFLILSCSLIFLSLSLSLSFSFAFSQFCSFFRVLLLARGTHRHFAIQFYSRHRQRRQRRRRRRRRRRGSSVSGSVQLRG